MSKSKVKKEKVILVPFTEQQISDIAEILGYESGKEHLATDIMMQLTCNNASFESIVEITDRLYELVDRVPNDKNPLWKLFTLKEEIMNLQDQLRSEKGKVAEAMYLVTGLQEIARRTAVPGVPECTESQPVSAYKVYNALFEFLYAEFPRMSK